MKTTIEKTGRTSWRWYITRDKGNGKQTVLAVGFARSQDQANTEAAEWIKAQTANA